MGLLDRFDPSKVITRALKNGGEFCDIYVEDSAVSSITCEDDKIERVTSGRDVGAGIRVISGFKTFYAHTNDVNEKALIELAGVVSSAVRGGAPSSGGIHVGAAHLAPGFDIKESPFAAGLDFKCGLVMKGNYAARGFDKRVRQVRAVYGDALKKIAVVNSLGEAVEEDKTSLLFLCHVVAAEGDVVQTGYEPVGGMTGFEIFLSNPPEVIAETAARRAVMMLSAKKAPGGMMTVVLSSEAGGTMIHEAVGHGLEADLAGEKLSVYSGRIGETVANPLITVIDDGTIAKKRGSFFFDDEGTPAQRTVLVDKGVLKTYMYDRLTAMKAGCASTGNGRRESYQHRPIPRMRNTLIAPGKTPPEDIIKSVSNGLFVKKMGGGQVNTVNGDFVFEVTEGYLIERGSIGEPVRGATLTGSGPDVLKSIDMVGNDLGFGIGTCGKDGQGVPVADAQPTLRIPEITVGGESQPSKGN